MFSSESLFSKNVGPSHNYGKTEDVQLKCLTNVKVYAKSCDCMELVPSVKTDSGSFTHPHVVPNLYEFFC